MSLDFWIITDEDWTVKPGNAFEDITCVVWNLKFSNIVYIAAVLYLLLNKRSPKASCHSGFSWLQYVCFSAFYIVSSVCFTAGNKMTFQNGYIARGQQ